MSIKARKNGKDLKIQPNISVLDDEHIQKVHQHTLDVLSQTGIRVDSNRAKNIFLEDGNCTLAGDKIKIPGELVEWAIQSAPSVVNLFYREGLTTLSLGGSQQKETIYGVGVTNSWYQQPDNDELVPFARNHVAIASALGNTLGQYDLIATPGVIQNDDSQLGEVFASLEMIANSHKPLSLLIADPRMYEATLDMFEHLHGDIAEKPFVLPYFNPITPLVLNEDTTDKMFITIERGLPFIFSSYGMSGATAPISAEGTLIMLNAELLAGLVLSQLIREGTPVVLGSLPSVFEMQNMFSAYTAQTMMVNLACAELMDHYKVPHAGTSGSGTGWGSDLLASGTLWMNHLTSSLGKIGLAPFVGGNFDSQAFSPTTVVYANEVIRQVRQLAEGFTLDEGTSTMDDIHTVGPGGSFLTSAATLEQYRTLHDQHSQIWPGFTIEQWLSEGSPDGLSILRDQTLAILEHPKIPSDAQSLLDGGEAFIGTLPPSLTP